MKVRVAQEGHRDHREITETHREKKGSVNLSEKDSVRSVKKNNTENTETSQRTTEKRIKDIKKSSVNLSEKDSVRSVKKNNPENTETSQRTTEKRIKGIKKKAP